VNPVPVLVGLDQTSAREGSAPTFDIRVLPVVPGAQVYFNDVAIPTTYVNAGRLRVSVPPALVVDNLDALITVENPGPGGGFADGTLGFTVYNLPPTATFSQERWTDAGRQLTFSLTNAADPSPADDFRYSFATSLAGLATTFEAAGAVNSQLLSFPTAGDHTAYGRIFDKDGGYTDCTATVHVAASNVAPVLSGANDLAAIAADYTTNGGTLVSALLAGKASDTTGGPPGIAVVAGATSASGTWQFSTNAARPGPTSASSFPIDPRPTLRRGRVGNPGLHGDDPRRADRRDFVGRYRPRRRSVEPDARAVGRADDHAAGELGRRLHADRVRHGDRIVDRRDGNRLQ
jgi:hypothetical protein